MSAFKVGAVLSALLFIIVGGILLIIQLLFGGLIGANMGGSEGMGAFGATAAISFVTYLVGIVVYAVIGAIAGAINALLYNIVAGMVGGIEVKLE
jgi:hypothetical protein